MDDPDVDLIDICTPNSLHVEIATAAARNGKNIYCEKPLGMDAIEARRALEAAQENNIITQMGFNYLQNPAQLHVKDLIESGSLGKVTSFRGTFDIDNLADPKIPHNWRMLKSASSSGALGDLASHTLSISEVLVGEVEAVCGTTSIVFPERTDPQNKDKTLRVENDDVVHILLKYKNGAVGTIASSRVAAGRKMSLTYELQTTKGAIVFNQERMSEFKLYRHDEPENEQGFKTIVLGLKHPEYKKKFGISGLNLGYNDVKTTEVHSILKAIADNQKLTNDFLLGYNVNKIIDAVLMSVQKNSWVS